MATNGRPTHSTFLVEQYWPGVTREAFDAAADRVAQAAADLSGLGKPIRFLRSTFVPEDEAAMCVFEAVSAEVVTEAYERAGVRYERIVVAVESRKSEGTDDA